MGCSSSSPNGGTVNHVGHTDRDYVNNARRRLTKHGKQLLDEFKSRNSGDSVRNYVDELLKEHKLPDIRFIKFERLAEWGSFPRLPDQAIISNTMEEIDRDKSLIVLISHHWLRGQDDADGWNGRAHPDNAAGDKYNLCVEGLRRLIKVYAPRVESCYVWMDYGCIDQDKETLPSILGQFDVIVQSCDCLFTPLVDRDHENWVHPMSITDLFNDYKASSWNRGPHAYLNRGWARLEMYYAANLPLLPNRQGPKRHTLFEAGLGYHCSHGRRPHFVYGTKEHTEGMVPCILPPLMPNFLTEHHPFEGNFSIETDKFTVPDLLSELQPYIDAHKEAMEAQANQANSSSKKIWFKSAVDSARYDDDGGYEGELRSGKKHGKGTNKYYNGDVYEGKWRDDVKHGSGKMKYETTAMYEGEWAFDRKNGEGKLRYADGSWYEGSWQNDDRHGFGVLHYADGSVYSGEWKNDKKDGWGSYSYWYCEPDGSDAAVSGATLIGRTVYEGDWVKGQRCGQGVVTYASGASYRGMWKNDLKNGSGSYQYVDGSLFEGEWRNGQRVETAAAVPVAAPIEPQVNVNIGAWRD